jgi:hypothetical protein
VALQVEQLDKEKRDFSERLRILHKRIDHLERAFRKEERPLLEQDYERQQKEDLVTHEMTVAMRRTAAQQKHQEDLEAKARLARMMADYQARCKEIMDRREEEYERRRAEVQKLIDAEKDVRRKKVFAERAAEQKSREVIEAKLRSHEEELRRRDIGTVLFLLMLLLELLTSRSICSTKRRGGILPRGGRSGSSQRGSRQTDGGRTGSRGTQTTGGRTPQDCRGGPPQATKRRRSRKASPRTPISTSFQW